MVLKSLWVLSPTLSLVFVNGRWLVEDPTVGSHRTLGSVAPWLASLLAGLANGGPFSADELRSAVIASGVPHKFAADCIRSLQKEHFLIRASECSVSRDDPAVRDYQWSMTSLRVDYSDSMPVLAADIELMGHFGREEPPPPQFPEGANRTARKYWLPHPVIDDSEHVLKELSNLLYFANGILMDTSIGPLPRTCRVPPSHGASHPFDFTVFSRVLTDPGGEIFLYNSNEHTLVRLESRDSAAERGWPFIISVHEAMERTQWRYRTSAAYPAFLLDLGHVVEVLYQVAEDQGLVLTELPAGSTPTYKGVVPELGSVIKRYGVSLES